MSRIVNFVKKNVKYYGFWNTLHLAIFKIINKIVYYQEFVCVVVSKVKQSSLEIDPKFKHGFLDADQLLGFSADERNELPRDFLQSVIAKGDECYVITENGNLASYGWYSHVPTIVDLDQLFCFDPSYVYMYKGFTKKDYRGQRLHAVGMSYALKHYLENGLNGIASVVDSTNFDSLKSCWRMGYEKVGTTYLLKIFGKVFHYSTRPARKYGIDLREEKSNAA
jgi:hypothetical protein